VWPAATLAAGVLGGVLGGAVVVGTHAAPSPVVQQSAPSAPTAEQVRAETVDLCTSWATAYLAMPMPQTTAMDVLAPTLYIDAALRRDTAADTHVRSAVAHQLRLMADQAAALSHSATHGAVQPPAAWSVDAANAADAAVWHVCHGYSG